MTMSPTDLDPAAFERLRRIGGDKLLREMLDLFLKHAPERVEAAVTAAAAGNLPAVGHAAHSLKSSAANVGATALQELAGRLEKLSEGGSPQEVDALARDLAATFALVRGKLEEQRKGLDHETRRHH